MLILSVTVSAFAADEMIPDFSPESLVILNNILRKLSRAAYNVKSSVDDTQGYLEDKVDGVTIQLSDEEMEVLLITDAHINVAQLSAISANLGTITAGTVTGATIQTAASGARVKMDTSEFLAYDDSSNEVFKIDITGGDVGDVTLGDYANSKGVKYDKSAGTFNIKGVLTATSGEIGGWTINATTINSTNDKVVLDNANEKITVGDTGTTHIQIDGANDYIQSSDFVSGALGSGWRIGNTEAEFQNIRARGKLTTTVFEKEAISIVGGNLLVLGGDILNADMTALDASTMTISGDETFAVNDVLRIKDGTDDEWFTVTNIGSAPTYTVTRDQGSGYGANSNPIWKKGTAVVNYGQSGTGGIFLTSSESDSPYIHFFTHAGSPWSTTTAKTRLGNLDGIPGASGWGIWAGDGYLGALEVIDTISVSSQGSIRSNLTGNYPYVEFSNAGLQLKDSDTGGTYGTATYTTAGTYGYGALAWIMNSDLKIPFAVLKEPNAGANDVADIRLYNRGDNPGGAAEVGDLAVVNGKLMICTGAGTPGTWAVVGSQN